MDGGLTQYNPLRGKVISLNGDSICAIGGGFGRIIAERNGMVYENVAECGASVTANTYSAVSGNQRIWLCRTIDRMRPDADYVILEGGVNDAALGVPMGTISDGYGAELDDTTYVGAFESMLRQVILRYPGKKIGYVTVHKMTPGYDSSNTENSYYYASLACCKKWGIPVCDLNIACPPLEAIPQLRAAYTNDGDGWHPTEEAYRLFYCDKIEAWMKTL